MDFLKLFLNNERKVFEDYSRFNCAFVVNGW